MLPLNHLPLGDPNPKGGEKVSRTPKQEESEAIRRSARKYRELCNQIGLAFRGAQEEAYETWCLWEAQSEADDELLSDPDTKKPK